DPETGLSARIDSTSPGRVRLRFGHFPEQLDLMADGSAGTAGDTSLRMADDGFWMDRPTENQRSRLHRLAEVGPTGIAGRYECAELEATLTVPDFGGVHYGGFSGFLGPGRMELLAPIGADVWALPCPRGLDHTPPGDWTLAFQRDPA